MEYETGGPLLGGLSPEQFLHEYWQKKPLLVRQAIPAYQPPLSPEELAGLACEEGVESRLILEKDGPTPWYLEYGPFPESRFSELPAGHWTLLVQEAHKYVPELAALLERFRFIPNWRVDDVMVSFAPESGSVGPHVDQYDVFLLQARGSRRWQISYQPVSETNRIAEIDLNIMQHFTAEEDWLLQPGDMLYLPPGMAHYGVAQQDCMTFSVGFRAPACSELLSGFTDEMVTQLTEQQRYTDADLQLQAHSGELSAESLVKVQNILTQTFTAEQINNWFGRFITEPKHPDSEIDIPEPLSPTEFRQMFARAGRLYRAETSRLAYIHDASGLRLFTDGEMEVVAAENIGWISRLCDERLYRYTDFHSALGSDMGSDMGSNMGSDICLHTLTRLYNQGSIIAGESDA